jgi:hypothetical protein
MKTETLIDASKVAGLKVIVQKTKYLFVSHDQNAYPNRGKNRKEIIRKVGTVQVCRNDGNKSKFDSGGN